MVNENQFYAEWITLDAYVSIVRIFRSLHYGMKQSKMSVSR